MTTKLARYIYIYIYNLVNRAVWLINSPLLFSKNDRKGSVKGEFDRPNSLVQQATQIY